MHLYSKELVKARQMLSTPAPGVPVINKLNNNQKK